MCVLIKKHNTCVLWMQNCYSNELYIMIPCLNIRKLNQTNTSGKQQIVAFGKDEYKYMLLLVILEKKMNWSIS